MRRTMIMGSGSVLEVERELEHPGLVAIDRELELEQLEREAIPIPRQWGPLERAAARALRLANSRAELAALSAREVER